MRFVLISLCGGVGLAMVLACAGGKPSGASKPPPAAVETKIVPYGSKITIGGVELSLQAPQVGKISGTHLGQSGESDEEYFSVKVRLHNRDTTSKREYASWSAQQTFGSNATLTDDLGNPYKLVRFELFSEVAGQLKRATLYDDKPISDLLVFQRPVPRAKALTLELPLARCGGDGLVKFRIPAEKIGR